MSEVNMEELWAVLEEVAFACSACGVSILMITTMSPLKNKTHTRRRGGSVQGGNGRTQNRADAQNLISSQNDTVIHFKV